MEAIERMVAQALALEVRTPETVVQCLGTEFVEKHQHLTAMLCDKNLDRERLQKMFGLLKNVRTKQDEETASEQIGLELAIEYVPAVREQYRGDR